MDDDTNSELGVLPFACLLNQIRQRVHQSPFYQRTPVEPVNTWKRLTKSKLWIIFCLFGWCRIRANLDIKWKPSKKIPLSHPSRVLSHTKSSRKFGVYFFSDAHEDTRWDTEKWMVCRRILKLMDQLPATKNNISSTGSTISVRVKTRWKKKKKIRRLLNDVFQETFTVFLDCAQVQHSPPPSSLFIHPMSVSCLFVFFFTS